jgi:hypothetical protein
MPDTILNLANSNKIDKPYLAGAYGQGGSTTFAFAPGGSLIASATADSALGITFVRYRALDPHRNKNGRYEYLVRAKGKAVATLPAGPHEFPRGTLVRHFDYDLGSEGLSALRLALFDPVLPFTLVESPGFLGGVPEIVRGRVAQLEAAGGAIEYRQAMTFPLGRNASDGLVRVQYWVLARDDDPLHADPQRPVLLTNFGQTHGTEDRRFIVETLRLPYLKSALIVSIELDALAPGAKRELLSTTRDRLKRGARYRALLDGVRDALLDDPELARANAERRRRLLDRQNATDQKRLRKRFAELMEKFRPGNEPGAAAARNGKSGATAAQHEAGEGEGAPQEPLPTLAHPTFVRIASAERPLQLAAGRTCRIALESDAPDAYLALHEEARIVLVPQPLSSLEMLRASDFRGGRARIAARVLDAPGAAGNFTVRLTDAAGTVHVDDAPFVVVEPPEPAPSEKDGNKRLRVPNVFEVYRREWEKYRFDEASVSLVAESRDDYSIFVNVDNRHLARLLTSVDYQAAGLTRMRTSYLVQVAFYAFLMHEAAGAFAGIDATELESYQRLELDRIARTVVSSIASVERIDSATLVD